MKRTKRVSGITLVEILVVLCVIAVIAGILVPTLSYARGKARTVKCVTNLNQISVAAKLYHDDHHGPPLANLPDALGDYLDSEDVFVCPEDRGGTDSYSESFVARADAQTDEFVVGCARHGGSRRGTVGFGKAECDDVVVASVAWNGEGIEPGDVVTGGELTFTDGSRVTIPNDGQVGLLMSFNDDGVCHSVIYVPNESFARLDCEITPGSRFEVITPACIAGVQGTKFTVITSADHDATGNPRFVTNVYVHGGKVKVQDRLSRRKTVVGKGQSHRSRIHRKKAPPGQNKKKKDK